MFKTIKGVYGKNKLVDLETLEFYNVQLPTQIVGIFMLLIEDDKVIVVKYAVWRKEWQWWGISWEWIRKVSYLYGLVYTNSHPPNKPFLNFPTSLTKNKFNITPKNHHHIKQFIRILYNNIFILCKMFY
jgi:hypothetical protein